MIIAGNQPYIFPYLGYFQLIGAADVFICADDYPYIKGGWINANRILMEGRPRRFTLALRGATCWRRISELELMGDFSKFRNILSTVYHRAPYYAGTMELIEEILSFPERNLGNFAVNSLRLIAKYLGIDTPILSQSTLNYDRGADRDGKIFSVVQTLGADKMINAIGGRTLYDREKYRQNGIELQFLESAFRPYAQLGTKEFVPGLSIIDVMMNCSAAQIGEMLNDYKLI